MARSESIRQNTLSTASILAGIFAIHLAFPAVALDSARASVTACQFQSLSEADAGSAISRATISAVQWVEYQEKVERLRKLVHAVSNDPGVNAIQALTTGAIATAALGKLSAAFPLHRCYEEAFTSNETLDTYFTDLKIVKGRRAHDIPYAMIVPKNIDEAVVLILPSSMYQFQRTSGSLRVLDQSHQVYVDVDEHARRGIDQLIQSNLAKLQNQ